MLPRLGPTYPKKCVIRALTSNCIKHVILGLPHKICRYGSVYRLTKFKHPYHDIHFLSEDQGDQRSSAEIHVTVVYMAWKMAKDSQVQVVVTFIVMGLTLMSLKTRY